MFNGLSTETLFTFNKSGNKMCMGMRKRHQIIFSTGGIKVLKLKFEFSIRPDDKETVK